MRTQRLTKIDNGSENENSLDSRALISSSQPWLNDDGIALSLEELRLISKNWDTEMWNQYLKYLEPVQKEKLVSPGRLQREFNRKNENIFSQACGACSLHTSQLAQLLKILTERQRQVIEMIYWKNMSHRNIAASLGIYQSTVADIKKGALKKMKKFAKMNPVTLPISKGSEQNDETKENQHADKYSA